MSPESKPTIVPRRTRPVGTTTDGPAAQPPTENPWPVLMRLPAVGQRKSWHAPHVGRFARGVVRRPSWLLAGSVLLSVALVGTGMVIGRISHSTNPDSSEHLGLDEAPPWSAESVVPPALSIDAGIETAPDDLDREPHSHAAQNKTDLHDQLQLIGPGGQSQQPTRPTLGRRDGDDSAMVEPVGRQNEPRAALNAPAALRQERVEHVATRPAPPGGGPMATGDPIKTIDEPLRPGVARFEGIIDKPTPRTDDE